MLARDAYGPGPNGMAHMCEDKIAELLAERETATRAQRKDINQRLHMIRDMLAWCKTRAGYDPSFVRP